MSEAMACPQCRSDYPYQDGAVWICPECAHEWSPDAGSADTDDDAGAEHVIRDANGSVLADGDNVTVIRDLKIKGASGVVKAGTKIRNIRLVDASDGHDIACKIPGIGAMNLKSSVVRKA